MRDLYHSQLPLTSKSAHPRAGELAVMSKALDAHLDVLKRVRKDLLCQRTADAKKGREGMSAEQVVRAALIKQMFSFSYSELSFHLGDSNQLRGFCRLSLSAKTPTKSNDSGMTPATVTGESLTISFRPTIEGSEEYRLFQSP